MIKIVIVYTLLWIFNLFNGTGLDYVYHVTDFAKIFVVGACLIRIFSEKKLMINKKNLIIYGGMIFFFIFTSIKNDSSFSAIRYLWVFCLLYWLSKLKIDYVSAKWIGRIYGLFGISILLLYNFSSIFSGWNSNSIAMIGMHSFLVFFISFYDCKLFKDRIIFTTVSTIYLFLLNSTVSRSCMIIIVLSLLAVFSLLKFSAILKTDFRLMSVLLIPLIIAIGTSLISNLGIVEELDIWSYSVFKKSFFNGRDYLWNQGFEVIQEHLFFGTGNLNYNNWHNSAITCLVGYGCVGFLFWIGTIKQLLVKAGRYTNDSIVMGAFIAFIFSYLQKSVELGLIAESPDILVYLILGILLGRINSLDRVKNTDKNRGKVVGNKNERDAIGKHNNASI